MKPVSSKINLSRNSLMSLYGALSSVVLIHETDNISKAMPEDLKLIHSSLMKKLESKTKKIKETYIVDLNVFEILYIQTILQSLVGDLGIKSAECQNYMFENRYDLNPCELEQLKKVYHTIFSIYQSLNTLLEKLQALNMYYEEHFATIMNMALEERIHSYLQIEEQIGTHQEISEKIIPIHRYL